MEAYGPELLTASAGGSSQRSWNPVPYSRFWESCLGLSDFMDPLCKGSFILVGWLHWRWGFSVHLHGGWQLACGCLPSSWWAWHLEYLAGRLSLHLPLFSLHSPLLQGRLPYTSTSLFVLTNTAREPGWLVSCPCWLFYWAPPLLLCVTQQHHYQWNFKLLSHCVCLHTYHTLYYIFSKKSGS